MQFHLVGKYLTVSLLGEAFTDFARLLLCVCVVRACDGSEFASGEACFSECDRVICLSNVRGVSDVFQQMGKRQKKEQQRTYLDGELVVFNGKRLRPVFERSV